ncbi:MFS general substrate transporter [Thozetella sp. PMI_491]|nr:MFS general substrate transporter [Thozetella sp. PMI_491]
MTSDERPPILNVTPSASDAAKESSAPLEDKADDVLPGVLAGYEPSLAANSVTGPSSGNAKADTEADPETLGRVPSGPAYSVFSRSTRRWVVTIIMFTSFVSPMTATIYFPALNPLAADLGVSVGLINLTLTTYMIFQSFGPTLFGDLGDMAGRRPAYIISLALYLVANLGLALQSNYAALLVLRAFQAAGGAGTLALGYAVVADISVSAERGKYMGLVGLGVNVGPAISPALGGILSQYLGWRSIFWFCFIYTSVVMVPYVLFVPETCRNVVGNGSIPPQGMNMTLVDYIRFRRHPPAEKLKKARKFHLPNPFNTFKVVKEKDLGLLIFFSTWLYLVFVLISATLSTQLAPIYHLNDLQVGLCYLPYGVGCLVAAVAQGYMLDWNYRRMARKIGFTINYRKGDDLRNFPIELARIQIVVPIMSFGILSTICFGWVLQVETNLAAPLIMLFLVGMCITGSFAILNTLLVDLYPQAPATVVAANNLLSSSSFCLQYCG